MDAPDALLIFLAQTVEGCDPTSKIADILRETRDHTVAARLLHRIELLPDDKDRSFLSRELHSKSADELRSLLQDPSLFEALSDPDSNEWRHNVIGSEMGIDDDIGTPALTLGLDWRAGSSCIDPAKRGGIRIDRGAPLRPMHPDGGLISPVLLPIETQRKAIANLDAAGKLLVQVHPWIKSFLGKLISSVILRRDLMRRREAWGATSGLAIGRILVVNAHTASVEQCAEILKHELVHIAIDCVELAHPFYITGSEHVTTDSPWTRNPLSAHALFHAAIVWASLADLWRALRQRESCSVAASARLEFIELGFRVLDVTAARTQLRGALKEGAFDAMERAKVHTLGARGDRPSAEIARI